MRPSSREGQTADDMQVVDEDGSCRRASVVTDTRSVSRIYNSTPSLVSGCARRRMAGPSLLRCCDRRTILQLVPALVQSGSDTDRCTPGRISSRRSQLKRSKADHSYHCGGLQHRWLGRARCPGCADVVLQEAGNTGL